MGTNGTALEAYLSETQTLACRLDAVLEGLTALNNEGLAENSRFVLAEVAKEMANTLNDRLDSVSIPKGAVT